MEVCIFNKVIILESNNDGASAGGNAEVKSKHLVLVAVAGAGLRIEMFVAVRDCYYRLA